MMIYEKSKLPPHVKNQLEEIKKRELAIEQLNLEMYHMKRELAKQLGSTKLVIATYENNAIKHETVSLAFRGENFREVEEAEKAGKFKDLKTPVSIFTESQEKQTETQAQVKK